MMPGEPVGRLPHTCTGSPGCSSSGKILLLLMLLAAGVGQQLGGPYHGPDWVAVPATTSWTKAAQPNKLSSKKSVGKPPCGGILSGGGGIARREQALRVCICTGLRALSSCKGAQKTLMYLLPVCEGRTPKGSRPQTAFGHIPTYNNRDRH